jgi:plasmid replication initiation protein
MKKFLISFLEYLTKEPKEQQSTLNQPNETIENFILSPVQIENFILPPAQTPVLPVESGKIVKTLERTKKKPSPNFTSIPFDPRDIMEIMEVPFLSLSKNRENPICYKSKDGKTKIKISAHREHYVASIYDWDIIQLIAGRIQEKMNYNSDIPSKTLVIERHKLIKSLRKHDVRKTAKEIESGLSRLNSTLIETTIRNEDYRYKGGFGFLDSWGYTERKDIKEFKITLSQWLYDGICKKGALLKVSPEYFNITSGIKKFLYRIARKHVGNNEHWEFSAEKLYEKSASEREFKKFKYDLKKAVVDNDIPEYFLEWRRDQSKSYVRFINKRRELTRILSQ